MQRDSDINPIFAKWRLSTGPEKEHQLQLLVKAMEKFAMAICWQRLPDHKDDLAALVNGTVWKTIRHLESFQKKSRFSTWFYRIVVNDCNKFLTSHKRRCETNLAEELPAKQDGYDAKIDLTSLLDSLEGDEHTLLRLMAEGFDLKEAAEMLRISHAAAKVRWMRLKEKLRDAVL